MEASGTPSLMLMAYRSPGRSPGMQMDMEPAGSHVSLEEEYAYVVGRMLQDGDAVAAVAALEMMCQRRAEQLWREVPQAIHRPARYMNLQSLAQEFEAQAATWHLVWCLYCNEQPPAGIGGPEVPGAAARQTARQILADKVSEHPALTRCAAVVAWLESLADDSLAGEGAVGQACFAQHEGVWLETKQRLGQGGVVSELDPDAPARQGAGLHPDNAAAEERLLQRCWQLIRAGRHADAQALCRACGQPWRAASLSGPTGVWGPLPVGVAAGRVEEEVTKEEQAEEMAAEVEMGGPAAARSLWKWSCLQVALQAAARATPGGQYEAAIYGVLCSHLPSILPLCTSWRDQCWAYCRTWLDQAADAALVADHAAYVGGTTLAGMGLDDVVVDVVCRFAGAAKGKAVVQAAVSAATTGQPPAARSAASGAPMAAQSPQSFAAIFAALRGSSVPAVAAATQDPLQQVQELLVQDAMSTLCQHVYTWLVPNAETAAAAAAGVDEEDVLGLPPRPTRMMAFGCHLLLVLEGLGVLYGAPHSQEGVLQTTRISGLSEQVVDLYIAEALMERGRYELVPQYLCHVREASRMLLAQEALTALTQQLCSTATTTQPGDAPEPRALRVYASMDKWFSHCCARQEALAQQQQQQLLQQEPGGELQLGFLHTTIRPQEARIILGSFLEGVRLRSLTATVSTATPGEEDMSPRHSTQQQRAAAPVSPVAILGSQVGSSAYSKACALRWLFYPYLLMLQEGGAEQHPLRPGDEGVWVDPLEMSVTLLADMALGADDACADAALHLLQHVIPQGFDAAAQAEVDGLQQHAGALRGQAAASTQQSYTLPGGALDQGVAQVVTEAAACEQLAQHVASLLLELRHWHTYFMLERQGAGWLRSFHSFKAQAAPTGAADAVELRHTGQQLLAHMQTELLTAEWMSGLPVPQPDGSSEEQLSVMLVLTQARPQHEQQQQQEDLSQSLPYPVLKGAELASFEQALRDAVLRSLASSSPTGQPRVSADFVSPPSAEGHLTLSLACRWSDAMAVSDVFSACRGLVQGSLLGAPQVLLVDLCAPRSFTTALCTCCCLAKAAVLCADLRYGLTVLGGDGSDGAQLVELLASAPAPEGLPAPAQRLGDLLSPDQLSHVLQQEAETMVQRLQNDQQQRRA